jgi:superfamily II DNA or RNA helicase
MVQVASVQTLSAQHKKGRQLPPASVLIADEAHHYAADDWGEILSLIRDRDGNTPALLGLTATPERGDGRPMGRDAGGVFDTLIPVSSVRELQTLDVLVPCVTYAPDHKVKALSREPVQAYQEHGAGERAFVFCGNVAHAESVAETFRAAGVPACTIHADTPWNLRAARLEAFRMQETMPLRRVGSAEPAPLAICNVYTCTEGVDVPEASVCIIARGCGHHGMFLQMVGRVLRAAPGKERAILWDLRGVYHDHGLPECDRVYSLDGKAIVAAETKEEYPRKCTGCGAAFLTWAVDRATGARKCPSCGAPAPELGPPEVVEREVFAVGSGADERARADALQRLAVECADKEYAPGWLFHRYRESFPGMSLSRNEVDTALASARQLLGIRDERGEV